MPAIEVSHLTKEYRLGALQSLKDTALNAGRRLLGRPVPERPLFKALDDVSFTVEPGEVVGIIGHNGAGKSTLLKMLARISTPTRGTLKVNGRIAPLIEVGAGFVPDFTGRENVYLNGAILGMNKAEIDRKFDEIVDFAEMAEFIDTPVKRYSSGMQVKLAFAVATSVESEILIVDEVLAVGDLAFQRKCFDRMEKLIRELQRTVLIVSHNLRQIERLCDRTLMLDHGRLVADGLPAAVCDKFYDASNASIGAAHAKLAAGRGRVQTVPGFELVGIELIDADGTVVDEIVSGQHFSLDLRLRCERALSGVIPGFGIHTTDFFYLSTHSSESNARTFELPAGTSVVRCAINNLPLLPGLYQLRVGISDSSGATLLYGENLCPLRVVSPKDAPTPAAMRDGIFLLDAAWSLRPAEVAPRPPAAQPRLDLSNAEP